MSIKHESDHAAWQAFDRAFKESTDAEEIARRCKDWARALGHDGDETWPFVVGALTGRIATENQRRTYEQG